MNIQWPNTLKKGEDTPQNPDEIEVEILEWEYLEHELDSGRDTTVEIVEEKQSTEKQHITSRKIAISLLLLFSGLTAASFVYGAIKGNFDAFQSAITACAPIIAGCAYFVFKK